MENQKNIKEEILKNPSLTKIYNTIRNDLHKVENFLSNFSDSTNPLISEINSYIFKKKGKRIRPALVLLCANLFDYSGEEHILMSALVEALHAASLIHDDIIDNSDLRRGKQTVHSKWGSNITVLLGDYLYIKTISRSLTSSYPQTVHILSNTSKEMIDGELLEYHLAGNLDIAENQYFDIIKKKTASLFATSCQLGGVLGKASKDQETALALYGENIGMSFQIIDDILDYSGDQKSLGKPVMSDLSEGRITLPLIHYLNNCTSHKKKEIKLFIDSKTKQDHYKHEIFSLLKANGSLDYSLKKAREYSTKANSIIHSFHESENQKALAMISDYILYRSK